MSEIRPVTVNISDSAPMKTEAAKQQGNTNNQIQGTNLQVAPTVEQVVHKRPYGQDGLQLSKGENYNPFSTILPNSQSEQARHNLKDDERKKKKKKEEKKKKNFWAWLLGEE